MNKKYIVTLIVDNNAGLLARLSGLFCRRSFNIQSITASETGADHLTRITIVTEGDDNNMRQLITQSEKLVEVRKVFCNTQDSSLYRELLLLKVRSSEQELSSLKHYSEIYGAKIIDLTFESMIFELTGHPSKIDAFLEIMKHYPIIEMCRTGITAIERGANTSADVEMEKE